MLTLLVGIASFLGGAWLTYRWLARPPRHDASVWGDHIITPSAEELEHLLEEDE